MIDDKKISLEEEMLAKVEKKRKKRKVKKIIGYSILLIIILVIIFGYSSYQKAQKLRLDKKDNPITIEEVKVIKEDHTPSIDVSGVVSPIETQNVNFKANGRITSVLVKEGDIVKKGEILATIDSSDIEYQLANIDLEIDIAKKTGSKKNLEILNMKKESIESNLEDTKVIANFDGIVAYTDNNLEVGNYITAGKDVITIIDNTKLISDIIINERDINSIKKGMQVNLSFSALPLKTVKAKIVYIPILGSSTKDGTGYKIIKIQIDDVPKEISSGYSFTGKINISETKNILIIPQKAINLDQKLNKSYVDVKQEDGSTKKVEVRTKYLAEGQTQVLSGDIKEGDTLIIENKSVNPFSFK